MKRHGFFYATGRYRFWSFGGCRTTKFLIAIALLNCIWLSVALPTAHAALCLVVTLTGTQGGPGVSNGLAGAGTLVSYGDDGNSCGAVKLQFDAGRGAAYVEHFLETKKNLPSHGFYKACCEHLKRLLGSLALDEVTRTKIAEYKQLRQLEPIKRHGNPVKGTLVRASTVNREITALIGLLNLAAENGVLEKIPATRRLKTPEDHLARERILDADEYQALLDASPKWLQRIIVGAYEACLSRIDLLTLTAEEIHRKRPEAAIVKILGGRNKTKARQKVPISPALAAVLDELDKVTGLHAPNLVFTRDGKPITRNTLRKAFDQAKKTAGLKDFHFHDLRHCAVTRWALAGIPEELRMLAAGHSRGSIHQRYINPPDEQMVSIFAEKLGWNCDDVVTQELRTAEQSAK